MRVKKILFIWALLTFYASTSLAESYLLKPDQIITGDDQTIHKGWEVLVEGDRIKAVGPNLKFSQDTKVIQLTGSTLLPGLMDLHTHLFLHPYNETSWDDQVLNESLPTRTLRASAQAKHSIDNGFTYLRDLGTEGASNADFYLKKAINDGTIIGPRLQVSTRAIVALGAYGPMRRNYALIDTPQGAEEVSGVDQIVSAVRRQSASGADWIKLYVDFEVGPHGENYPTLTEEEIQAAVKMAHHLGRKVSAHATSEEGMRLAAIAGVDTIEHGFGGTEKVFKLMAAKGITYVPTLTQVDYYSIYFQHYDPLTMPPTADMQQSEKAFRLARRSGVSIATGSDAGVYPHGENGRELIKMVAYGMTPIEAIIASTVTSASVLGVQDTLGKVKAGFLADLIAVDGNPLDDINNIRKIMFVMKDGKALALYKN